MTLASALVALVVAALIETKTGNTARALFIGVMVMLAAILLTGCDAGSEYRDIDQECVKESAAFGLQTKTVVLFSHPVCLARCPLGWVRAELVFLEGCPPPGRTP